MRKIKKYKPKPVILDPISFMMSSVQLISSFQSKFVTMKIKTHAAMTNLVQGKATKFDIDMLINTLNVTEALYRMGFGTEYKDVVKGGLDALYDVASRGASSNKFILYPEEMNALNEVMDIHDAQLEVITVRDLDKAIELVRKVTTSGNCRRVKPKEEETV